MAGITFLMFAILVLSVSMLILLVIMTLKTEFTKKKNHKFQPQSGTTGKVRDHHHQYISFSGDHECLHHTGSAFQSGPKVNQTNQQGNIKAAAMLVSI